MSYERLAYKDPDADMAIWKLPEDPSDFNLEKLQEIVFQMAQFINESPDSFSVDTNGECWYINRLPINSNARVIYLPAGGYLIGFRIICDGKVLPNRGDWGVLTREELIKVIPNIDLMKEII